MTRHTVKTIVALLVLAMFVTSCSKQPREHAWQFWRRPASVGDDIVIDSGAPRHPPHR